MKINIICIQFLCLFAIINPAFSMDVVHWNHGVSKGDNHRSYKAELITAALDKTELSYGPYRLIESDQEVIPQRALQQLQIGQSINIFMAVTSPEWEAKTIPIRIPIRRGILNYRLLAINKSNLAKFTKVKALKDLQTFSVGLGRSWATVALFESYGYPVIQATKVMELYDMLSLEKIDYIPRGLNEAFDELEFQKNNNNNQIVIEPSVVLRTQAPYYIFVSPKEKRLAERLEAGLEMMIKDKSLHALFYKHYGDKIKRANLSQRKVIQVNNPLLTPQTPLARKELWFEYDN